MNEIPKYVQNLCTTLLMVIKSSPTSDIALVREFLMDAARYTVDLEMAKYTREWDRPAPTPIPSDGEIIGKGAKV